MKKFFPVLMLALAAGLAVVDAAAQGVNITIDGESMQAFGKDYNNMKGSPYLYPEWTKGSVKLTNGIVYEGMDLIYDQLKDELIFNAEGDKRQLFMNPVHEFVMHKEINSAVVDERVFRNGFPAIDGAGLTSFFEVLNDGDTKLLKRTTKAIVEERPDGSIVKEKQIKESVKYYISTPGKMTKINQNKKSVLAALDSNKAQEVLNFLKENQLNLKEDAALEKLIAFYNTL
ncbi:hypothetical protein ACSX1A_15745 [Pontibacter sp. MBLB2868]|uniref:hypothetical protein n=1 Tax=Pontibacter sp. MBLB2868 TaxID=3451555 RepID=UPI003F7508BA